MTSDPVTIRSDQTIGEALVLMFEHDIRHLPVIAHGKLVGMVSDRDIRQLLGKASIAVQHREEERRQLRLPVTEIMATHLYTVEKTTPIADGVKLMVEHKVGAVPVVDSKQRVVGIFSELDALRYCLYLIERYQGVRS
jgi:acetoin utilization protein AcuB